MEQNFKQSEVMWKPNADCGKKLKEFKKRIENKYCLKFNDYWEFHEWSVNHISEFWAEVWDYSEIIHSKTYQQVVDESIPIDQNPIWFEGATLNYTENLLRYRDDRTALIVAGEDRETELVSYKELFNEVSAYAAAFRKLEIKKNDVVACYMSNRKEAIFAMLGVLSIGAIWTGTLPQMGPQPVLNRISQTQPIILITIDEFIYDKKEFHLLENIQQITDNLPSLKKVIIVSSKGTLKLKDISNIKNSCLLEDFLKLSREPDGTIPNIKFEQVPFSHPVFISFTSGTTGLPKPLTHGIGMLLNAVKDYGIHCNLSRDSVWLTNSPVGWGTWNIFTSFLFMGIRIALYDGLPFFLHPTSIWDLIDEFKVSHIFVPASVIDEFEKKKFIPTGKHSLKSLKAFLAGGSVVKPSNYDFMYKILKGNGAFSSLYGTTEMLGSQFLFEETLPIYKGEINCTTLGNKVECLNDFGEPILGDIGELALSIPVPSVLLGLWGDTDGSKCKEKYYGHYPGKFMLGDHGMFNPVTKGLIICGRSDDTLKQRGVRFGSAEIYNLVENFVEVRDSLCVSHYNKTMDERAVLFLKMRQGHQFSDDLVHRIQRSITVELTSGHIPDVIIPVKDIPYNMNGKKLEILVKKIINKKPYNTEVAVNPDCLKYYENREELQDF